jgi:hypothetical protein|tara:strand:+ start:216 stop:404 length:189 start_codon:yes stop_codon:yes gene_type:complete
MDNKQILKEINDLNVNDMKKLFHSYLVKTAQNIQDAKTSLEVLHHATNLNTVLCKDIDKFVN